MSLSRNAIGRVSTILLGALMSVGAGCTPPAELPPQTTSQLANLRDGALAAKAQVQAATNSAKDLLDQPRQDLGPQIDRLKSNVATLNATRNQGREQISSFQKSSAAYFQKWDDLVNDMSAETAEKGQERMEKAKESLSRLQEDINDIRTQATPYMGDLNEATNYLATDTTNSGLDVVRPKLKSAVEREPAVLKGLDRLVADIDSIRAGR